jgi:hypothetical protein
MVFQHSFRPSLCNQPRPDKFVSLCIFNLRKLSPRNDLSILDASTSHETSVVLFASSSNMLVEALVSDYARVITSTTALLISASSNLP